MTTSSKWWHEAACQGMDIDVFFPAHGGKGTQAKKVCARCDVSTECLNDALHYGDEFGIRGGLTIKRRLKHKRQQQKDAA